MRTSVLLLAVLLLGSLPAEAGIARPPPQVLQQIGHNATRTDGNATHPDAPTSLHPPAGGRTDAPDTDGPVVPGQAPGTGHQRRTHWVAWLALLASGCAVLYWRQKRVTSSEVESPGA